MDFWLALAQHYMNGHLWCVGGIGDQPEVYMRVMKLITTWKHKFDE